MEVGLCDPSKESGEDASLNNGKDVLWVSL